MNRTPKKHIVIIEDDEYMLTVMRNLLEYEGYHTTGLLALSTIENLIELKADCFIIDEQLPRVNGHIICMMLKSKPQTKDIPVILTSAFTELEGFATLSQANAYLKKPFPSPNSLLDLVAAHIDNAIPAK